MNHLKKHALVALASLATTCLVTAAPGRLDTSFNGVGGIIGFRGETPGALAIAPDGKIISVGQIDDDYDEENYGEETDILICRYNADGKPDTTFSEDGKVRKNIVYGIPSHFGSREPETNDHASAVAVQPGGKILVAGTFGFEDKSTSAFLLRFNNDGSLDTSFGDQGRVTYQLVDIAASIAVLGDGKILVGGTTGGTVPSLCVTRFNSDGSLDQTFTANGKKFLFGPHTYSNCSEMVVQPDGKIVMAGTIHYFVDSSGKQENPDSVVMRLTPDGLPDTTFDGDGHATTKTPDTDLAKAVQIQPDGKILVGGSIYYSGGKATDASVTRYTSTGELDPSFSDDGIFLYPIGRATMADMVLQKDGKIVLVGTTFLASDDHDVAMARITPNGVIDLTFGAGGIELADFGWYFHGQEEDPTSFDSATAAALQADGKLVVLGGIAIRKVVFLARFSMDESHLADAMVGTATSTSKGNNVFNSTGADQTLSVAVKRGGGRKITYVRIQNDGKITQPFMIKGTSGSGDLQVKYMNGSKNVTSQVIAGAFKTTPLASGKSFLLRVEITARTKGADKSRNLYFTGSTYNKPVSSDTVRIKIKSS